MKNHSGSAVYSKSASNRLVDALFGELTPSRFVILAVFAAVTILLELAAYIFGGAASVIASRVWMAGVVIFAAAFLFTAVYQLISDIKGKRYLIMAVFLLILAFFVIQIGNYGLSDLSYEATQETVAGLEAFDQTDWNYTGKGFIQYPVKQYLINAIPSLILGRSFFALNLGFALPFLTGLIMLFIELRRFLAAKGIDEKYALLPVFMISFSPYIDEFYYIFEQTITPVSYVMIIIALFLRAVRKPCLGTFVLLTSCVSMLPFLYTPALAFMGLFIVIAVLHAVLVLTGRSVCSGIPGHDLYYALSMIITAVSPVLFFVCTIISNREDRYIMTYSDFDPDKHKEYLDAFIHFFTETNSLFFGIFGLFVLVYMLGSIFMRFKVYDLLVTLWCVVTAYFSFMLPGVAETFNFYYGKELLPQRSMIIIPVLAVCMLLAVTDIIKSHNIGLRNDILVILSLAFLFMGFGSLFTVHKANTYNNGTRSMNYIVKHLDTLTEYHGNEYDDEFVIAIHSDNGLYVHPYDYLRYFYPNAKVYIFPTNEYGALSIYDAIFPKYVISESEITQESYYTDFKLREYADTRSDRIFPLWFIYFEEDYSYVDQYDDEYIEKYNLWQYRTAAQ